MIIVPFLVFLAVIPWFCIHLNNRRKLQNDRESSSIFSSDLYTESTKRSSLKTNEEDEIIDDKNENSEENDEVSSVNVIQQQWKS